ncbi:hypothetical protein Glove_640g17 [Diversispora epigaea]|uniref:Uncharacterized protein n=1 Tax=Diversispora epigaea TaxID=1348612 RepID=A0A397G9B6_9GLOM|nr:hypothetical protein Glove_640g17 [Diversispora epigaea]
MSYVNRLDLQQIKPTKKPLMASTILVKPINDIPFACYLGLPISSAMAKNFKKMVTVTVSFENYLGLSETSTRTTKKIRNPSINIPFVNYLGLSLPSSSFPSKGHDDDGMKNDNNNVSNNNNNNNNVILEEIPIQSECSTYIKRNIQNLNEIVYKLRIFRKKLNTERPSPSIILNKLEDIHLRCVSMKTLLNSHK